MCALLAERQARSKHGSSGGRTYTRSVFRFCEVSVSGVSCHRFLQLAGHYYLTNRFIRLNMFRFDYQIEDTKIK